MKLTKSKLKQIIREELQAVLSEGAIPIIDPVYQAQQQCKKGYKAACHALEWVKKCEEERKTGDGTGQGPACQRSYKLLKSYGPDSYGNF